MLCKDCGAQMTADARICGVCGWVPPPKNPWRCPDCWGENEAGAEYCHICRLPWRELLQRSGAAKKAQQEAALRPPTATAMPSPAAAAMRPPATYPTSNGTKPCVFCKARIPMEANFCTFCGKHVPREAPSIRYNAPETKYPQPNANRPGVVLPNTNYQIQPTIYTNRGFALPRGIPGVVNRSVYIPVALLLGMFGGHWAMERRMGKFINGMLFCWTGIPMLIGIWKAIKAAFKRPDSNGNIMM